MKRKNILLFVVTALLVAFALPSFADSGGGDSKSPAWLNGADSVDASVCLYDHAAVDTGDGALSVLEKGAVQFNVYERVTAVVEIRGSAFPGDSSPLACAPAFFKEMSTDARISPHILTV